MARLVSMLAVADTRYQARSPNLISSVRLLDRVTGAELRLVGQPGERTSGLAFSPDGKLLVSYGDKTFHLWDVASGKKRGRFAGGGGQLHFTPDGKRFIAVGAIIRVWDVESGQELHPPEGPTGSVSTVAFAPDAKVLAASSSWDPRIFLWEAATGRLVCTLPGHESYTRAIEFTPDGKLLSGGGDSTLRLWDRETGKEVFRFKLHDPRADEKPLQVLSMSVSRDGRNLAAACLGFEGFRDQTVRQFVDRKGWRGPFVAVEESCSPTVSRTMMSGGRPTPLRARSSHAGNKMLASWRCSYLQVL